MLIESVFKIAHFIKMEMDFYCIFNYFVVELINKMIEIFHISNHLIEYYIFQHFTDFRNFLINLINDIVCLLYFCLEINKYKITDAYDSLPQLRTILLGII